MRAASIIALLLLTTTAFGAEEYEYSTRYKGVTVGKSDLAATIRALGKPAQETVVKGTRHYHFGDVRITFTPNNGPINSIIIYDRSYRDANGFSVGAERADVIKKVNGPVENDYAADFRKGIVYWFEGGVVSRIVLAAKLVDPS